MSMEAVLNSFWDTRLHEPPKSPSIHDLVGDRISFWAARTKDGKAKIVSVIPYKGIFTCFDCIVKLEHFDPNGNIKYTEMSYNSKEHQGS